MVMKMCISDGVTMIQCRWKCYDLIFGFSVLNYPRIHSSLILLSLRLAELGSLEAFHYSNNNSKEISCSLCCTSSSSFSLFLSLSLSLFFSLHPTFLPLSLSVHWSLSQARRRWKFFLRSSPSLVLIPTRSVTYTKSKISSSISPTSCSILYILIHTHPHASSVAASYHQRGALNKILSILSIPLSKTIYSYHSSLVRLLMILHSVHEFVVAVASPQRRRRNFYGLEQWEWNWQVQEQSLIDQFKECIESSTYAIYIVYWVWFEPAAGGKFLGVFVCLFVTDSEVWINLKRGGL